MGYNFYLKFPFLKAYEAERLIVSAVDKGLSFNAYQRDAITGGLSFRREDMLDDWNRASGIEKSRSIPAHERAETFFTSIIDRIAETHNVSTAHAFDMWNEIRRKEEELEERTEEEEDWWERYERLW